MIPATRFSRRTLARSNTYGFDRALTLKVGQHGDHAKSTDDREPSQLTIASTGQESKACPPNPPPIGRTCPSRKLKLRAGECEIRYKSQTPSKHSGRERPHHLVDTHKRNPDEGGWGGRVSYTQCGVRGGSSFQSHPPPTSDFIWHGKHSLEKELNGPESRQTRTLLRIGLWQSTPNPGAERLLVQRQYKSRDTLDEKDREGELKQNFLNAALDVRNYLNFD